MGLKWDLGEDTEVISNLKKNMLSANEFASDLSSRVKAVVSAVDGGELSGRSYNAAKSVFQELFLPIARGISIFTDDLDAGVSKYKSDRNLLDGTSSIDEDKIRHSIQALEAKRKVLSDASVINPLISMSVTSVDNQKRKLTKKLEHLHEFNSKTSGIFDDDTGVLSNIIDGINYINNGSLDGKGNFQPASGASNAWLTALNENSAVMVLGDITRPKRMNSHQFRDYKKALVAQAIELMNKGWAPASVRAYGKYLSKHEASYANDHKNLSISEIVQGMTSRANKVGSKLFLVMWDADKVGKGAITHAQSKLTLLMKISKMPNQLDGTSKQTKDLLNSFGNISPDNVFWGNLARTVRIAFPDGLVRASNKGLAQKIHQYRYVISAQQMQYVRDNYALKGGNDRDALINYLSDKDHKYSADESARLHQKRKGKKAPNGFADANIKVVQNFNTEFILDSKGSFINEIDPTKSLTDNENGIVNGASFNYATANDANHQKYDVRYGSYDPKFRKNATTGYEAPEKSEYQNSNSKNYSTNKKSSYELNQEATLKFIWDVETKR